MDLMATYSQRRSGARNGARAAEAAIREERERQAEIARLEAELAAARRKAARATEASRAKFTASDLAEATHVRDSLGWHHVVRVNAKSVTVMTEHSWTERIPLEQVLQYALRGIGVPR